MLHSSTALDVGGRVEAREIGKAGVAAVVGEGGVLDGDEPGEDNSSGPRCWDTR